MKGVPFPGSGAPLLPGTDRLGFVGLGRQGAQIVRRWLAGGYAADVYDIRASAADDLVDAGATRCRDLASMARTAALVAICVVDDAQVESVVLGTDGLISTLRPGCIVVIHSTVSPNLIRRLARALAERGAGLVDAPVSGGAGEAGKAMSFMIGGAAADVARCLPLFGEEGPGITLTGPSGTGMAAKLAHQLILCMNMYAAEQGARLATAAGVDLRLLDAIAHAGVAQSNVADRWSRRSMTSATAGLLAKDLALCRAHAQELGVNIAGIDEVMRFMEQWRDHGPPALDTGPVNPR